jgi:nucleotide-binding universal stress UspA family protein
MLQRILVAIDCSDTCSQIFEEALTLAVATHASLLLLHVLSPLVQGYPHAIYPSIGAYPILYDEANQSYVQQLRRLEQERGGSLRLQAQKATDCGVPAEYTQVVGDPGQTICEMAQSWQADTIMIGRRGRSGLGEIFLGSVSNYVVHHAPCSVMVVQGLLTDAEALQQYLDVC